MRGNPRRRPIKKTPDAPPGLGDPPSHVAPEARECWPRLRAILEGMRVATSADRPAFEALCEAYGEWQKYRRMLNESGGRIVAHPDKEKAKQGAYIFNPAALVDKIESRLRYWLAVFGLTPSDRAKLAVAEKDERDEFAEYEPEVFKLHRGGKK